MAKRRSLRDTVPKNYACASPSASPSPSLSVFSQGVEAGNVTSLDANKDAPPNLPSRNSISMASTRKWSLDALLKYSTNFVPAQRVPATSPGLSETMRKFETLGEPLVVEGYHHHPAWPHEMFTLDYFVQNTTSDEINVRNIHDWTDRTIKLSDFVNECRNMSHYASPDEKQRLYGKDAECPEPWENWLHNGGVIPLSLVENGPQDLFRYRPDSAAVQTLMCYLGIGDTFTPCHKDLCASSGQNLMCYTEDGGASFWFMTKGSSSADAAKYFHSLGRELDHENHVITLEELANAPFQVFIIEQKLGDLVLVPPRSCHQVVNFGGITIKTSWSRMTLDGLSVAYFHELPIYRRVCRPEIYRVKDTIHHALLGQTKEICSSLGCKDSTSVAVGELKELLFLYDCILAEEFSAGHGTMHHILSQSGNVSDGAHLECDFCHGDIFQSFFDCSQCTNDQNPLLICSGCFVEGRRCRCKSMRPVQYRNFKQLIKIRDQAENAIRQYEETRGQMFTQELALENASVPPLFRAACYLNKNLKDVQRLCSTRTAHNCGLSATLYCKQCHGSRCLSYVMNGWHVHPAEALMAYSSDPTNTTYHTLHLNARHKFKKEKQALEQSQKLGTRLQGYSLLLYNALNFVQCNPLNLEFVQPGWYDRKYEVLGGQVEEDSTLEESEFEERSSSGTIIVQRSSTRLSGGRKQDSNDHQMPVDRTAPIKKRTSVYVDVPKAPYPIHRQRASSGETTNAMVHADMGKSQRGQSNWQRSALLHSPTLHPFHSRHSMTAPEASKGSALERSPELGVTTLASIPSLAKKKLPSSLHFKKISRTPHDAESSSLVSLPPQEVDRAAEPDHGWGICASQTADPSNPQVFNSNTQYPRPAKLTSSPTLSLVLGRHLDYDPGPDTVTCLPHTISAEQNMEIASLKAMREVGMLMQETADTQLNMLYDHIGQRRQHQYETQQLSEPCPRRFERPQSSNAFYNKQAMYHQDPPRAPRGMSFWNDRNHSEHRQDNKSFVQHQAPVGVDLPAMSSASMSRSETFKPPKKRRLNLDDTGSGASEPLEARYLKGNKYMERVQEAASGALYSRNRRHVSAVTGVQAVDQHWEDIRYEQLDEPQGSRVISMHQSDGGNMHMNFEHELTKNHWID